MRRRTAFLAAVVLAAAFLYPASASASVRGDAWRAKAAEAFAAARYADSGSETPHFYAAQAGAGARLNSWTHAYTASYLSKLYTLDNPDGGYGLKFEYDAFSDGTVNGPDTTYLVTITDHVGRVLLDGFRAGVVPRAKVQTLVNLVVNFPRIPGIGRGACLAYSSNANDVQAGLCVHNVNAGAALFLHEAAAAGFGATGMHALIVDITLHEIEAARHAGYGEPVTWPYVADGVDQDVDHNSYSAESVYRLAYWLGREAVYQVMDRAWSGDPGAPVAHMRLVSMPGGIGSTSGTTTLWCVMGDDWMAEADAWIAGPRSPRQLAQAALAAAKAAKACA